MSNIVHNHVRDFDSNSDIDLYFQFINKYTFQLAIKKFFMCQKQDKNQILKLMSNGN